MRKLQLFISSLCLGLLLHAQETFPVNGVADQRDKKYAFVHATIIKDAQTTLQDATLLIEKGKIISVGNSILIPNDAVIINCKDKYIYPSFIDPYTDYGVNTPKRTGTGFNFNAPAQINSNTKGAYNWNQAIKPETEAYKLFSADETKAKVLREMGYGVVLTHVKDGIVRGSGAIVSLAENKEGNKENLLLLKEKASAHYSFNKGASTQSYPSSLMGSIALLRQTYLDAQWYKTKPVGEGKNISLEAFNELQDVPQIFESDDKWTDLRAQRVGNEFGVKYIIKCSGNEYQRIDEIAKLNTAFIVPINFPQALDVEDPNDARLVSLSDMKHWELAPTNPGIFEKAKLNFSLTSSDIKDSKQFYTNLRKAIDLGLSENQALDALTKIPATQLNIYNEVGSLDVGKIANFLITSGPIFNENSAIYDNWIQGEKYELKEGWNNIKGNYKLTISTQSGSNDYHLTVKNENEATVILKDTVNAKITISEKIVRLSFATINPKKAEGSKFMNRGSQFRLSGFINNDEWNGTGVDTAGNPITWTASYVGIENNTDSTKKKFSRQQKLSKVTFPFDGYGWEELPKQEDLLIKNATVWTNEKEGILDNTDILIKKGKIVKIGKNLSDENAKILDATGKHVTAGIIDEHSHIAAMSINEGAQSVTSEVRIGDNLNPEDINIYRQLSGGVTSSHILHGSANTIGGQTQLIKLRWGASDEDLKFKGADPFIKFALGENVKRTTSQNNNRFPDTRMGVDQVMDDAFSRAKDYEEALKRDPQGTRKDLELDALVEILNKKRFITCHSYVQSEITAAMRIAEKYNFKFNTFTHILEGYKVADKMKLHGSNASTFSDWWAYKQEVVDAIAYNAAIMQKIGLNVCINSDDAEQARRLNQEAAKTIKYGGISEEDALKMVTLNPAKALHVADRVGSIKTGKDADIVIWSNHPLSIYAMAEKTIVDGIIYFDRSRDLELRKKISSERNRLIQKLLGEKKAGSSMRPVEPSWQYLLSCGDHEHHEGLITIDISDDESINK